MKSDWISNTYGAMFAVLFLPGYVTLLRPSPGPRHRVDLASHRYVHRLPRETGEQRLASAKPYEVPAGQRAFVVASWGCSVVGTCCLVFVLEHCLFRLATAPWVLLWWYCNAVVCCVRFVVLPEQGYARLSQTQDGRKELYKVGRREPESPRDCLGGYLRCFLRDSEDPFSLDSTEGRCRTGHPSPSCYLGAIGVMISPTYRL